MDFTYATIVQTGGGRMKCEMCGTSVAREAHDRGICFDCYCILSLADYEEHQKKNTEEE